MSGSVVTERMEALQNFHKWLFNSELEPTSKDGSESSCLVVLAGESDKKKIAGHLIGMEIDSSWHKKMGDEVRIEYSQTKRTEHLTVAGLKIKCQNSTSDRRDSSDAIPVFVLVCINSTESRFEGSSSRLTKTLNELQKSHLIDKEKQNLIIVITNACSIPYKNVENWKIKLREKSEGLQNHVENVTGVRAPFVVLENSADDFDLEVTLEGTKLPDGTEQPANLLTVVTGEMRKKKVDHVLMNVRRVCTLNRGELLDSETTKNEAAVKPNALEKKNSGTSTGRNVELKKSIFTGLATLFTCTSVYYFYGILPAGCAFASLMFLKLMFLSRKLKISFFTFGEENQTKDK